MSLGASVTKNKDGLYVIKRDDTYIYYHGPHAMPPWRYCLSNAPTYGTKEEAQYIIDWLEGRIK